MTTEQKKFYDIKNFTEYETVGDDVQFAVIIDNERKELILQYQESKSREDWKNNLSFLPWPLKLGNKIVWTTHGYARAYQSTMLVPIGDLYLQHKQKPDYKLIIRGWSFGSAMAKIAARHFIIKTGETIDELTTFGDVKCWVNPFTKYKKNIKVCHEYATINDFVTWCVPFYHRTNKCKVGDRFSIRKLFQTEYYHTHYEEYDYSKYEGAN